MRRAFAALLATLVLASARPATAGMISMHRQLPEEACERLQNMMEAFQERFDSFWDKWEDRDWPHSDGKFEELKEKIQARHQEMRERFLDLFDNWRPDMDDEEEDDQQ